MSLPIQPPGASTVGADLSVRDLEPDDMAAASALLGRVWDRQSGTPMDAALLVALRHSGNYVAGAFERGELVAVCAGFLSGPQAGPCTPTSPASAQATGRGIGTALKLHQRAWCRARDIGVDRLDLRPAHRAQRLVQPPPARSRPSSVPRRLLRRRWTTASTPARTATGCSCTGRRARGESRRRPERSSGRRGAGRGARTGDPVADRDVPATPRRSRWSRSPATSRVCAPATSPMIGATAGAGAVRSATRYAGLHEQGWRLRLRESGDFVLRRPEPLPAGGA